jgi:ABC-type sugar transport system ATPase subunit
MFVAAFIGSPAMNLLRGVAREGRVLAGDLELAKPGVPDGDVVLGLRPETLQPAGYGLPTFQFEVQVVEPLGDEVIVHGLVNGQLADVETGEERAELLPQLPGSRAVITARLGPQERPKPGERRSFGVRPDQVHVFDALTGLALG